MSDTDWNSNAGGGFGTHRPEDEFFHGTGDRVDSLTETWFWNFHVAEAAINCFIYCWIHPTLGTATAGLALYQGLKESHMECELYDLYDFMSADMVGDGRSFTLPNGLSVMVVEPLNHVRIAYADDARETAVDLDLRAVGVPIMRANNKHFEQVMHVTGTLLLRGERHRVDCHAVRDRSWGEPRPEAHNPIPPYTWVTGTFGTDLAFNVGAHDDPTLEPDWLGVMPTPARLFMDGWVVVHGEQRRIVAASKVTRRAGRRRAPVSHHYRFEDSAGEAYEMEGRLIAQMPKGGWSNMTCHLGLVEWRWNGRTGYGESQEVQWNDYVWRMNRQAIA